MKTWKKLPGIFSFFVIFLLTVSVMSGRPDGKGGFNPADCGDESTGREINFEIDGIPFKTGLELMNCSGLPYIELVNIESAGDQHIDNQIRNTIFSTTIKAVLSKAYEYFNKDRTENSHFDILFGLGACWLTKNTQDKNGNKINNLMPYPEVADKLIIKYSLAVDRAGEIIINSSSKENTPTGDYSSFLKNTGSFLSRDIPLDFKSGEKAVINKPLENGDYWSVGGNSNTDENNFIGTAGGNASPLVVKTNGIERMRVEEDGQIIISSNDPENPPYATPKSNQDFLLAVEGKILTQEIVVTPESDWPDYVFDDDYQLMPIEKLELKIEKEKKLPGMPSAGEAGLNGVNLSDMQIKLLKKIEELTLYMIELKKDNKELKQKVGELEKQLQSLKNN